MDFTNPAEAITVPSICKIQRGNKAFLIMIPIYLMLVNNCSFLHEKYASNSNTELKIRYDKAYWPWQGFVLDTVQA